MKTKPFWAFPATAAILLSVPAGAVTYLSVQEAQKVCFEKADSFQANHVFFTAEQKKAIEKASGEKVRARGQQIWHAYAGKNFLGYFIIDYVIGKHEVIDYAIALSPKGVVQQVEILEYRESYGWEIRNKKWREQFVGKTVKSSLKLHRDIVNIGGATLSCRHVTEGVKRILVLYDLILKKENPKG